MSAHAMSASKPPTMPGYGVSSRDRNPLRCGLKTAFPVLDNLTTLLLPAILKTSFPSLAAMLICYCLGQSLSVPHYSRNQRLAGAAAVAFWPFGARQIRCSAESSREGGASTAAIVRDCSPLAGTTVGLGHLYHFAGYCARRGLQARLLSYLLSRRCCCAPFVGWLLAAYGVKPADSIDNLQPSNTRHEGTCRDIPKQEPPAD